MTEGKIKKPKEGQKINISVLTQAQDKLGLLDTAFSTELGYAANAMSKWRKDGKAPFVAGLAAEGLVRRLGSDFKPHYGDRVWLLRLTPDQQTLVGGILKAMHIKWTEV
jgi:hypothetical protein